MVQWRLGLVHNYLTLSFFEHLYIQFGKIAACFLLFKNRIKTYLFYIIDQKKSCKLGDFGERDFIARAMHARKPFWRYVYL